MTAKEEREKRLAAQLRANLRRRKAAPGEVETPAPASSLEDRT